VSSIIIVVIEIPTKNLFKMTLIPNNDVIGTFSSNTAIESFNIGILTRATICGHYLLDIHGLNATLEEFTENPVSIPQ